MASTSHALKPASEVPKQNTGPSGSSFRIVTPEEYKLEVKGADTSQLSSVVG